MSSQKKSSRLEGKDLITIGIYTVIYVVIVMLVAMLGFIPIFIPLIGGRCAFDWRHPLYAVCYKG